MVGFSPLFCSTNIRNLQKLEDQRLPVLLKILARMVQIHEKIQWLLFWEFRLSCPIVVCTWVNYNLLSQLEISIPFAQNKGEPKAFRQVTHRSRSKACSNELLGFWVHPICHQSAMDLCNIRGGGRLWEASHSWWQSFAFGDRIPLSPGGRFFTATPFGIWSRGG
jgi:hypothetical protein